MWYHSLKILHILSAALLLMSLGYCYNLWRKIAVDPENSEKIQMQTWKIIFPVALFQLLSGFTIMSLQHYDFTLWWIRGSVISFIILMLSWFGFIYFLLIKQLRTQKIMLLICGLSLLSMIFLMANRI